jgi:hypothetical protein
MTGFWVAIDWTGLPFAAAAASACTEQEFRAGRRGDCYRVEHWPKERGEELILGFAEWRRVDAKLADVVDDPATGIALARRFGMPLLAIQALAQERLRARMGGGK